MSPNLPIQQALLTAISTAGLTLNGQSVAVYTYAPTTASAPYVLVTQVSTVPTTGSISCQRWRSIYQLTIVTTFQNVGQDLPSLLLEAQLTNALDGQILSLTGGFQMQSNQVSLTRSASEYDGKLVHILRYIQLEVTVYQD